LRVTGIQQPAEHQVDGLPLDTLFSGKPDATRQETFLMHFPHTHRTDYFTVYRDGPVGSQYQLFNLKVDPFEQNNLAARNPNELSAMMKGLIESLNRHDAVYPRLDGTPIHPKMP